MTNNSPWRDPPLTGTPLDYVPIDAPIAKRIEPTKWRRPSAIKRGALAGASAAATIGVILLFPFVLLAIPVLLAFWWLTCLFFDR